MSVMHSDKKHSGSIVKKVIFAFLLAVAAVLISWALTKGTFLRMLHTVDEMGKPSPKLQFVNQVFREVVKLDQLQRAQALARDEQPYNIFLEESQNLQMMLDTLQMMSQDNPSQVVRIDSMKRMLRERDRLLLDYIRLRINFINNDTLSKQIRKLSEILATEGHHQDNSVVTTEMKTTTIIEPVDSVIPGAATKNKVSFWERLVGKRKEPEVVKIQRLVQEDLKIQVDTLAVIKEDSLIHEISSGIATIQSDMQQTRLGLRNQQMQLSRSGQALISEVLVMLQVIESEEMALVVQRNAHATSIVNKGIDQLKLIMYLFIAGAGVLLFLIFADIARSNRYRTELIAAKEEAEQLGKVKERFLANMSHELRTPLQSIVGTAEQMQLRGTATSEEVDVIYRSSRHLLQSVNEVLDYSRITSGRLVLEHRPFDMQQLLKEVAASIKVLADQKGLKFSFEYNKPLPQTVYVGDAFRLKQILYNLLSNSVKFTDAGEVSFRLEHADFSRRTTFIFSIADTGPGIAPADQDRIFREFERVAPDSKQGTGLGLSIVSELVDAFKGAVYVESEQGKGSVFKVNISLPKARNADLKRENEMQSNTEFNQMVWVIDDDKFILNLCSGILSKYNVPHLCFNSAADLLAHLEIGFPHTILMDIRMPEMDGYALLDRLKSLPENRDIRIVALTAQAMPDEQERIRKEGFDGLLMKPFLEKDLMSLFNITTITPSVSSDEREEAPASFATIKAMVGDDDELFKSTLLKYAANTEEDLQLLESALARKELNLIAELLHRLAGRTGQMGAKDLAEALRKEEIKIRSGKFRLPDSEKIWELMTQLIELVAYTRKKAGA